MKIQNIHIRHKSLPRLTTNHNIHKPLPRSIAGLTTVGAIRTSCLHNPGRRKKIAKTLFSALVLILTFSLNSVYALAGSITSSNIKASDAVLYGPYQVERVVDGDTIIIDLDGERTRVRLKSIDTPESVHPNDELNSEAGMQVSDIVKELLNGTEVYLEYEPDDMTDKYDRTLAYVYLSDARTMVNAYLIEEGYATFESRYPCKYKEEFSALQDEAIRNNKGLWRDGEMAESLTEPVSGSASPVVVIIIIVAVITIIVIIITTTRKKKHRW